MVFSRKPRGRLRVLARRMSPTGSRSGAAFVLALAGFAITAALVRRWADPFRFPVENVAPDDAIDLIDRERENPDFVILDVRTPSEFARGRLAVALNVSARSATFRDEVNKLDKEKVYLVYSGNGGRSRTAAATMKRLGFKNVFHLAGGITGWDCAGLPVVH